MLEDRLHRYSVGIILTPAHADPAIVRRSFCHMLMKDHSDSLVLIVLRIVLRTVLSGSNIILGIVLRTILVSDYNHPRDRRHRLIERVRKMDLASCLKDSIVDDSLDNFE